MKKQLTIALLAFSLTGCHKTYNTDGIVKSDELEFNIMRVGKCQYLYYRLSGNGGCLFTHSGECTNSLHHPVKICGDTVNYNIVSSSQESN